jgi:hypothetical protein
MSMLWTVDLREHDRTLVATIQPESLHFRMQLGVDGPHEIQFETSLSAEDSDGRPIVSPAFVGPYRHDWYLKRAGLAHPLMAGPLTEPYGGADASEQHVKFGGKDWLHRLELRCWPYNATLSYVNWPAGFRFSVAAAEVADIVKDIVETVRDLSGNFPGPPGGANPSYFQPSGMNVDVDNTGKTRNYEIARFESSSIYDLIRDLASADKADGGFDFLITWDRVFRLVYPELGDPSAPVIDLRVDPETGHANMLAIEQTNVGPAATHVLGVGAGTANRQGGVNKHFRNNSEIFGRIDKIEDFGDVKDLAALESLTSSCLSFNAHPHHELPVKVDPNQIPDFWTKVRPGRYADVHYNLGYAKVPNETPFPQRIVSLDCDVDSDGNEEVTLGLNQHFEISANAGLDDW